MDSGTEHLFSAKFACPVCSYALQELEPRLFSFNNPMGACPKCDGLGQISSSTRQARRRLPAPVARLRRHPRLGPAQPVLLPDAGSLAAHYGFDIDTALRELPEAMRQDRALRFWRPREDQVPLPQREPGHPLDRPTPSRASSPTSNAATAKPIRRGARGAGEIPQQPALPGMRRHAPAREARHVLIGGKNLPEVSHLPLIALRATSSTCCNSNRPARPRWRKDRQGNHRAAAVLPDQRRPRLPVARPLGRNALRRRGAAHPPGQPDRLRPHRRDVRARRAVDRPAPARQRRACSKRSSHLRDLGNTVIVVEHDEDAIRAADYVVDMGPGAGEHGGRIVAEGTPAAGRGQPGLAHRRLPLRPAPRSRCRRKRHAAQPGAQLRILGARGNNLKNVTLDLPVGLLTCITGVSGSGKSTLINDTLYAAAARHLYGSSRRAGAARRDRRPGVLRQGDQRRPERRSAARRAPTRPPTPAC
jgi:excinuclease ABC subunit A